VAMTKEKWLSTARARLGITPADRWFVYGTGGVLAILSHKNNGTLRNVVSPIPKRNHRRRVKQQSRND
jgi:hypothetical protein